MTRQRDLFGHPFGLSILFATEVWERFAYYGMRALLVLYMTDTLLQPKQGPHILMLDDLRAALESIYGPLSAQALSSHIYGLYTALIYLTPIAGGLLADRLMGQGRCVILGGVLMAAGQFSLGLSEALFLPGLFLIILGNGCFKPNISSQVGYLYAAGDARRDRAFSLFYLGINFGSAMAPVVCGTIGELYGWRYGFIASGVGMVLGLAIFMLGRAHLPDTRPQPRTPVPTDIRAGEGGIIAALIAISLFSVFFWAAYDQKGNVFNFWVRDYTDRSFFGLFELRTTWFQSVNAILIVTLTPPMVSMWNRLAMSGREPSTLTKLTIGCFGIGCAYIVLALAGTVTGDGPGHGTAHWGWAAAYLLILTLSELCFAPIGLSLVSRLAPRRLVSMMIGVWLLGHFGGSYLAGVLGQFWSTTDKAQYWAMVAAIPTMASAAFLLFRALLKRAIHTPSQH